jgi:hypothetical protein
MNILALCCIISPYVGVMFANTTTVNRLFCALSTVYGRYRYLGKALWYFIRKLHWKRSELLDFVDTNLLVGNFGFHHLYKVPDRS